MGPFIKHDLCLVLPDINIQPTPLAHTQPHPFGLTRAIYASEHARLWLHWPQHPFMCHQLPYMVKQRSSSQKYNHPLASSIWFIV